MPPRSRPPAFQRAQPAWIIDDIFKKAGPPVIRQVRKVVRQVISKESQLATARLQAERRARNSARNAITRAEERAVRMDARGVKPPTTKQSSDYAKRLIGNTKGTRVQRSMETQKRMERELEDIRSQAKAFFPKENDFKKALDEERKLIEKAWAPSKRAEAANKSMKKPTAKTPPAKKAPAKKGTVAPGPVKKKVPQQYLRKS
jgi:hypothetical protein